MVKYKGSALLCGRKDILSVLLDENRENHMKFRLNEVVVVLA